MADNKPPRLFLSPPHMSGREAGHVAQAFASNYIAPLGPQVDAFEAAFAEHTGIAHCLAVSSGTAAIHLALRCLGVGPGDLVLAATLTFVGSVAPAAQLGADLAFIDADRASWNMDPERLREALEFFAKQGRRAKAVIPTDLYGQCADYARLLDVCAPFGVPLLADCAESVGARYGYDGIGGPGRHAGSWPGLAASIFSFNGNKIITTSGGGMLASADAGLVARARKLSQQAREPAPYYEHVELGYNYRLSNILAAIGLGQLETLEARGQTSAHFPLVCRGIRRDAGPFAHARGRDRTRKPLAYRGPHRRRSLRRHAGGRAVGPGGGEHRVAPAVEAHAHAAGFRGAAGLWWAGGRGTLRTRTVPALGLGHDPR